MDSSTTALVPATSAGPLPHLAEISTHFTPAKWAECIDSMIELTKSGSENVKVRAFEALTKVVEISEAARTAGRQKTPMRGGMFNLTGDVNINVGKPQPSALNELDEMVVEVRAEVSDELAEMRQRALDATEPNGSSGQ